KRAHLDELRVVRRRRHGPQAVRLVQVGGLVEDGFRGGERAELDEPRRFVAGLFRQLALSGGLFALARLHASGGNLPAEGARHVAPLADEDDRARVEEWQHADGGAPAVFPHDLTEFAALPVPASAAADAPESVWPTAGKPFGDLLATLRSTRERSHQSFDRLAGSDPRLLRFKHFRLGDLDLA